MSNNLVKPVRNKNPLNLFMGSVNKERANSGDTVYTKELERWVLGETSTVSLRDELCAPFSETDYGMTDMWDPHFNAFAALDSWAMKVKPGTCMAITEIPMRNGDKAVFSHFTDFSSPVFISETMGNITVVDDKLHYLSPDEEPGSLLPDAAQSDLFERYSFDFSRGDFVEKDCGLNLDSSSPSGMDM